MKTKIWKKAAAGMTAAVLTLGSAGLPAVLPAVSAEAAELALVVPKFENPPVIDGTVSEQEWGQKAFSVRDGEENISILDEGGVFPADFNADIYLGYDSGTIYIAAVATYDIHKNEALLPADLWAGDCMQIQISPEIGTDRNELGFTLNSLTDKLQAVAWASTGTFTMEGGEGKDYIVSRDGNTTVYEIALGVDQFTSKLSELPDGMTLPFSLSFHMSGGGFLEYAGGIVQSKDIAKAALIGLGAEPDANAAPPATEETAMTSEPEAGNNDADTVAEGKDDGGNHAAGEDTDGKDASEPGSEAAATAVTTEATSDGAAPETTQAVPAEQEGQGNTAAIIIVIAVIAAAAVAGVIILKKKKNR